MSTNEQTQDQHTEPARPEVTPEMRTAITDALASLSRAQQAATGAAADDLDAILVVQRLHTAHGRLGLVDPHSVTTAGNLSDPSAETVAPTLTDCRRWVSDAADRLDATVQGGTGLLPPGLLTVRADIAETLRVVDAATAAPRL